MRALADVVEVADMMINEQSAALIACGLLLISGAFFVLLARSKSLQQFVLRKAAAKHTPSEFDPAERESLVHTEGAPPKSCLAQVVPDTLAQVVVRPDADTGGPATSIPLATATGGMKEQEEAEEPPASWGPEPPSAAAERFVGAWQTARTENYGEFLKIFNMSWPIRKIAEQIKPQVPRKLSSPLSSPMSLPAPHHHTHRHSRPGSSSTAFYTAQRFALVRQQLSAASQKASPSSKTRTSRSHGK